METKLIQQASQLRCYQCGSPDVTSVCHHCGRAMCSKHGPAKQKLSLFTENREFLNLRLGNWPLDNSEGAHCEYHIHSSINYRRLMILPGVVFLIIGLFLTISSLSQFIACLFNLPVEVLLGIPAISEALRDPQAYQALPRDVCYAPFIVNNGLNFLRSVIIAIVSLGVIIFGWRFNREKVSADLAGLKTALPVGLVSDEIEILETLNAEIMIDKYGGSSSKLLNKVKGKINPGFRFSNQDIKRLESYIKKYSVPSDSDVPFQAGFLSLQSLPESILENEEFSLRNQSESEELAENNLYILQGEVNDFPYLTGKRGRSDSSYPVIWNYELPKKQELNYSFNTEKIKQTDWGDVPVRIIPMVVQFGNERSLYLQIQLNQAYFPTLQATPEKPKELTKDQVLWMELAQIWVDPSSLGRPRSNGAISEIDQIQNGEKVHLYQVEWRNLYYSVQQGINFFRLDNIDFDQSIPEGAHLRGRLRIKVPALYSGIQSIRYFSALGNLVTSKLNHNREFPTRLATYLNIEFDLALAALELASLETLSCPSLEKAGPPTPNRVRGLLDALNSNHYGDLGSESLYVRNVVESTPQIREHDPESGSWQWDISGRYYKNLLPVDFHVVVYGKGDREKGLTRVDTTVQGQIIESGDDTSNPYGESQIQLQLARDTIHTVLKDALENEKQEKVYGN